MKTKKKNGVKRLFFGIGLIFASANFTFVDLEALTIRMTCRSKGCEIELCKKAVKAWTKKYKGKHRVEIVTLPHASNECFALYKQWLSAETFDIDVMLMDVAWVDVFSNYLYPLDEVFSKNAGEDPVDVSDYFDAVRESMYDAEGHLVALPWYTDCGIIYYRTDLLDKYGYRVPKTWEELYETALEIQSKERKDPSKKNKFYGFVFQAKAFEVLTSNFLEFVDSFGGAIVENKEKSAVDSDACVAATAFVLKCLSNITNRSVLNYSEEDARGVFQSGNAVFMRNWPYAWALMNEPSSVVSGRIGVMPIPKSERSDGKASGTLGGWYLVVSKFSKHPEAAADLIRFLTSKSQQKFRAKYSYLPTFKSLYSDPEVLKSNPFFTNLVKPLSNAVVRPSKEFGKDYPRASSEIYNGINTLLANCKDYADENEIRRVLNKLNKKLQRLLDKAKNKDLKRLSENVSATNIVDPEQEERKNKSSAESFGFWDKLKSYFSPVSIAE